MSATLPSSNLAQLDPRARRDYLEAKGRVLESMLHNYCENETISRSLVFQGGGALHFVYNSPRYSENLDFVCPAFRDHRTALKASLEMGLEIEGDRIFPNIQEKSKGEGPDEHTANYLLVTYSPRNLPKGVLRIFERSVDKESYRESGRFSDLKVETPDELYADKMKTVISLISQGQPLNGKYLYDLDYITLSLRGNTTQEKLTQKAEEHKRPGIVTPEMFKKVQAYLKDPRNHNTLKRHIEASLMPDVLASSPIEANYFDSIAWQHFEPEDFFNNKN
jgi:beta-galactosidase beta subunit